MLKEIDRWSGLQSLERASATSDVLGPAIRAALTTPPLSSKFESELSGITTERERELALRQQFLRSKGGPGSGSMQECDSTFDGSSKSVKSPDRTGIREPKKKKKGDKMYTWRRKGA